jgi:lactate dehydrogenase-like 2-hydroxyacid dehydrogenase
MLKDETINQLASPSASEAEPSHGPLLVREIGFVGLGHMGTEMAANLAAAGHRVIAYVRRPDQMDALAALGLKPTTEISTYSTAKSSSACCPTIPRFATSYLGEGTSASPVSRRG